MTRDEINAILARADAATAGPWDENQLTKAFDSLAGNEHEFDPRAFKAKLDGQTKRDARFAAHARTDIPALCTALLAAMDENAALRQRAETAERERKSYEELATKYSNLRELALQRAEAAEAKIAAAEEVRRLAIEVVKRFPQRKMMQPFIRELRTALGLDSAILAPQEGGSNE